MLLVNAELLGAVRADRGVLARGVAGRQPLPDGAATGLRAPAAVDGGL